MLKENTIQKIIERLVPDGYRERESYEQNILRRSLPFGAEVTRVAPSPTGFVHIGTIYTALLCKQLADQTDGLFYLRIEDTDKKREIEGGDEMIVTALRGFGLNPAETYKQSERSEIYLAYAIDLLKKGRAYPCFATSDELESNSNKQRAAKLRPGYYGEWALWRDASDEAVNKELDAENPKPFVLRFKSEGSHNTRVRFKDELKGTVEFPQNDLDIPLIKGDGSRLPTYHLAHIVDDYLMGTTLVLRGDEWLPSTPLHIELATALNISPFRYAHIAPITILDAKTGGKRKLSKRKDPEANVAYFYEQGYPIDALRLYLFGLANADLDVWFKANPNAPLSDYGQLVTLEKLAKSRAPLFDQTKLDFYASNVIGYLPQDTFNREVNNWLSQYGVEYSRNNSIDPRIVGWMQDHAAELVPALAIERTGEKVRKDVSKWSDVIEEYGYFVDTVFEELFAPRAAGLLEDISTDVQDVAVKNFLSSYDQNDDQPVWFEKLRSAAKTSGFALDNKDFKTNPSSYFGNVADFARIFRVKLTGKTRTPDLYAIMRVMGKERVQRRLNK